MNQEIASLAARAAACWGESRAVTILGGTSLSYARLDMLAGRFAAGLAARGVRPGDRILLYLPNGWHWLVAYHAIARLGGVIVPANSLLSRDEVAYMVADSGARALMVPDRLLETAPLAGDLVITPEGIAGTTGFAAVLDAPPMAPVPVAADDLLTIAYTSGTTGQPKGVMLSHGNVAGSVAQTATIHVRHPQDRVFSALPLTHVYGNVVMNASLLAGADLFIDARFDPGKALEVIGRETITLFEGVPTMYYQMLAHPAIDAADLSSLTRCTVGGQTMPVAKIDAVVDRFGCPLLELWGMTEVAGPAISHSPYWPRRHGSIGLPFPGTEARLADLEDAQRDAELGQPGELMVRGPLASKGYWNRPEVTAEAIDAQGWLATGDIARRDRDGYLFIVDRRKDMILTAGYNVYPAEIEAVIARHPDVGMVGVAGFPDEEKGELAHAFVVLKEGATLTRDGLTTFCRASLAAYKAPRAIHFVDDLPRTGTGKILRRALRVPAAHA